MMEVDVYFWLIKVWERLMPPTPYARMVVENLVSLWQVLIQRKCMCRIVAACNIDQNRNRRKQTIGQDPTLDQVLIQVLSLLAKTRPSGRTLGDRGT